MLALVQHGKEVAQSKHARRTLANTSRNAHCLHVAERVSFDREKDLAIGARHHHLRRPNLLH